MPADAPLDCFAGARNDGCFPSRHVWMAPDSQGFFRVRDMTGTLRSCVRPVGAAPCGRRPWWEPLNEAW